MFSLRYSMQFQIAVAIAEENRNENGAAGEYW